MTNILDQFCLDPIGAYDGIFEDTTPLVEQYLAEATTGTTKKNLFQKMIDFVKNIVGLIIKGLKKIAAWFKSIFTKRKKTANQAAEEAFEAAGVKVPSVNEKSISKSASRSASKATIAKGSTASVSGKSANKNVVTEKISVVKPDGTFAEEEFNTVINDYGIKIMNDKVNIGLNIGVSDYGYRNYTQSTNIDHAIPLYLNSYLIYAAIAIAYEDKVDSVINAIRDMIKDPSNENVSNVINQIENFKASRIDIDTYSVKADEINQLTTRLNAFASALENSDIEQIQANGGDRAYRALNDASLLLAQIQYGLNTLTSLILMSDTIGDRWKASIDTPDLLDKVVKKFIDAGIPSGILAYNIAFMASPELAKYSDVANIPQGQSRATLFPEDESLVYKFATNNYGRIANKNDMDVVKLVSKAGLSDYIAKVLKIGKELCVETVERADTSDAIKHKSEFESKLDEIEYMFSSAGEFGKKTGRKIEDIHENNVGYIGTRMVLVDYGDLV